MPHDFDVFPEHAAGVARAKGLHAGLLGGETAGQVRDGVPPARTIGNLPLGEDAAEKTVAVPLEDVRDPRKVSGVDTQPDDVHECSPA